ncbi:3-oxoacid CoA-transferase subunit B [Halanaerobium sp.]|uniref:3-oxoacid CoA-transferase subunit B n=1 Tax=Halanaerobium sp. TaxID=1895664 RepID=UPI000DE6C011|nr:3-oxoacid CoA-transferase subunit B [Halanaerobium sp.]PUU86564.1 MAG: Butyrate-acetoacetate CoA-transferase subunit B [Halanaerobium sp.]
MDVKEKKEIIVKRIAKSLEDGDVVNLGIGMPTLVANHISDEIDIMLQSENGFLGLGPKPEAGKEDKDLTNAGGEAVTVKDGAMFFDSAESFTIIRGGHVDKTILGALQVDAKGNLANWMIPNKIVPGMGGAMDLVVGAKEVIIATLQTTKRGNSKILAECTLPLTAKKEVDYIVTEMGYYKIEDEKLILKEINPDFTIEEIKEATDAELIVAKDLKEMIY